MAAVCALHPIPKRCLRGGKKMVNRLLTQRGSTLILMLGGGSKSTQDADIEAAKALAKTIGD